MCGITGFTGRRDPDTLKAMTRRLAHRGPDGEGFYESAEGVYFGHRRLAIIDVIDGAQPMFSADRSIVVVFNGEIYNHVALREELTAKGHRFETDHSDTEVLIHGYKEWGSGLPARLNGMFAFAIHDTRRHCLFLARDRFGEKPLFIFHRGDTFAFASELSALTSHPAVNREIDGRSLQKLFAYGYLPGRTALYRHCFKLPAGSHLTLDLATGDRKEARYWQFRIEPDHALNTDDDDRLAEELRALLQNAVKTRMVSDVPLGLFLSGGLDSSSVLAMASRLLDPTGIKTFTVGFDEPSYDETTFAKQVADHFGTCHHAERLMLDDAKEMIEPVLAGLDEPLGDASLLPTYLLSRFTRQRVTVALTGDGGDELFAGYDPFRALAPAGLYTRFVPGPLHRVLRSAVGLLPASHANMSLDFKLRRALQGLSYAESYWNPAWMSPLEPDRFSTFFSAPLPIEELYSEALELWSDGDNRGLNTIDRTLEFFTTFYLTDDILVKADRASMAHSLESRCVFLDNDLVDFCARLPHHFKYRNGQRKYLLKKAMEPFLPKEIVRRRKKGFGIPISEWLKEIPTTVPMAPVAGMRIDEIAKSWRSHRAGLSDERLLLWCWLALQATIKRDGFSSAQPLEPLEVSDAH